MSISKVILTSTATCALSMTLTADVRMPKIFGDNMVLQREMTVPVWGWAGKGEKISVSFAGQEKTAIAGEDGKWMVKLDPLKASKEPSDLIVSSSAGNPSSPEAMPGQSRQFKIKNVLVGEGNKIRIEFDHAENGLLVGGKKGLAPAKEIKDGKLGWIVIAGDDRKFYFADAVIDGKALMVSSGKVTKPVAVRYHFTANPEGLHLYNREGLPATPFRTDAW